MEIKMLFKLFSLVFCFAFPVQSIFACTCRLSNKVLSPEEQRLKLVEDVNRAQAIFTGEVIKLDEFRVTFKIEKLWKGNLDDEVTMLTGAKDMGNGEIMVSSCDYEFNLHEKYLVFAYGDSLNELRTHKCTRTKPLTDANKQIEELDEVLPHQTKNQNSKISRLAPLFLIEEFANLSWRLSV